MRFPDFLIIGGMKCGSTTVYRDLMTHPRVYFPIDKEPHNLVDDSVLSPEGRAAYAELFAKAEETQLCGEASTGYTKHPDHSGVAPRAEMLCGKDLRLIYAVREPVSRIASHHHHELTRGEMPEDLGEALDACPALLDYSRYAMQAEPWVKTFGPERLRVVPFERYTKDRTGGAAELMRFLGLDPVTDDIDESAVFNKSAAKPVTKGPWALVASNPLYRGLVRPLLSQSFKDKVRHAVLPKSRHVRRPPTARVAERIYHELEADLDQLRRLMGSDAPVWDAEAIIKKHRERESA